MVDVAPAFEHLSIAVDGPIGRLTLDRPEKLNPLGSACLAEIADAARWFDTRRDVRVVIVSGAGRAFSAGADLSTFQGPSDVSTREAADLGRRMADAVEDMAALTIAAVHGWCVGGGVVLAAACDLRLVAASTTFTIPEVDLGIPLAWGGIPRLVREIGPARTKELVITCRPFDAAEAAAIGFANRVVDDEQLADEATALAEQIATKATLAVSSTKRHVDAVTSQMVGLDRAWNDADGLVAAFADPECGDIRRRYLADRG